ncbi:MAG: barstar family protein [Aeromicrobium sp.]
MTATFDSLLSGTTSPGLFDWRGRTDRDLLAEAIDAGWSAWPLDTSGVSTPDSFFDEVRAAWGLPPWFGDDLDALFDALGEMASHRCLLVWDGSGELGRREPDLASSVLAVLRDAVDQADALAVVLRGDQIVNATDGLL